MDKWCPLRTAIKTRKLSGNYETLWKLKKKKVKEGKKVKENIHRKYDVMSEEEKSPAGTWEKMKWDARAWDILERLIELYGGHWWKMEYHSTTVC